MLLKYLYIIVLVIFINTSGFSQNGITSNPDWQIKPAINQGFILIHRSTIGNIVKGYPTLYELNVSKPTLGNKLWHLENNKPDIGITLQYIDFKNPQQLGSAFVAAPYIEIPLNVQEKKSRVLMRLCWGATYITKKFDVISNRKNIAIGSHINAFVQFRWFWQYQLTKKIRFEPGLSFSHASNGRSQNPNLGLNVLSVSAAINMLIPSNKPKPETFKVDSSTKVRSKNEVFTFVALGFNQREIATKRLKTIVVSSCYQRNVRNTHKFSAGVDFFYDQNYLYDYEIDLAKKPQGFDKMRVAARLGYSYNIGRISLPIELGYYLFQKTKPDGFITSRIGVRYYSTNGLVLHFGLRTHFAVAYCFDYGLGCRIFI